MLEAGPLVPMIASWPGKTPAGKVSRDLVDSTDFLPTFAELAGVKPPPKTIIDGRSLAPRIQGKKSQPRDWIFIQLARQWYVREAGWKLNQAEKLFDMSQAPFEERLVGEDTKDPAANRSPEATAIGTREVEPCWRHSRPRGWQRPACGKAEERSSLNVLRDSLTALLEMPGFLSFADSPVVA